MTDYNKLVTELRITERICRDRMDGSVMLDAADAIEKLITLYEKAEIDATNLTGKLTQAEAQIDKLRQRIDELEEKQTYCDAYGDKWMTSGKDVPTEAYKHGYADGRDEAMAKMDGPIITPCRGCSDYDGYGGCKSKGGCARAKMEVQE